MALYRGRIIGHNPVIPPINIPYFMPGAVHFDGATTLFTDTLASRYVGTTFLTIAGWFKTFWDNSLTKTDHLPAIVVSPDGSYNPWFGAQTNDPFVTSQTSVIFQIGDSATPHPSIITSYSASTLVTPPQQPGKPVSPYIPNVWQHIMVTARGDLSNPQTGLASSIWVNGWNVSGTHINFAGEGGPFNPFSVIPITGQDCSIGSDLIGYWVGDMADISMWNGIYLPNGPVNFFIDPFGQPLSPSDTINAVGATPVFMLSGDTRNFTLGPLGSTTGWLTLTGQLTNAETVPTGANSD